MPRVLHMALLITFMVPCTKTLMAGLRWSMIVGPRLVFVNKAGMVLCGVCNRASIACRNRGTKFKSLLIVSVIGQFVRASQIGSASAVLPASDVPDTDSCHICSMLVALAFVSHS